MTASCHMSRRKLYNREIDANNILSHCGLKNSLPPEMHLTFLSNISVSSAKFNLIISTNKINKTNKLNKHFSFSLLCFLRVVCRLIRRFCVPTDKFPFSKSPLDIDFHQRARRWFLWWEREVEWDERFFTHSQFAKTCRANIIRSLILKENNSRLLNETKLFIFSDV